MGRLTLGSTQKIRRLISGWILPVTLTVGLLIGVHSFARADTPPSTSEIQDYLTTNSLHVGTETVDGYQQVFYDFTNHRHLLITNTTYSNIHASASGQYIVWQGLTGNGSQIFRYDLINDSLIQLTSTGTNQNPFVYQDKVAWESWVNDRWQIFFYDGLNYRQLTSGQNPCIRPVVNGQQVVYAEQVSANTWRAISYDIQSGQFTKLREADEPSTAYPKIASDGTITTDVASYYR